MITQVLAEVTCSEGTFILGFCDITLEGARMKGIGMEMDLGPHLE